jgi:hypothetical protein
MNIEKGEHELQGTYYYNLGYRYEKLPFTCKFTKK